MKEIFEISCWSQKHPPKSRRHYALKDASNQSKILIHQFELYADMLNLNTYGVPFQPDIFEIKIVSSIIFQIPYVVIKMEPIGTRTRNCFSRVRRSACLSIPGRDTYVVQCIYLCIALTLQRSQCHSITLIMKFMEDTNTISSIAFNFHFNLFIVKPFESVNRHSD